MVRGIRYILIKLLLCIESFNHWFEMTKFKQ